MCGEEEWERWVSPAWSCAQNVVLMPECGMPYSNTEVRAGSLKV